MPEFYSFALNVQSIACAVEATDAVFRPNFHGGCNWSSWELMPCGWTVINRSWSSSLPSCPYFKRDCSCNGLYMFSEDNLSDRAISHSYYKVMTRLVKPLFLFTFPHLCLIYILYSFLLPCDCTTIKVVAYKHIVHCGFFFFFDSESVFSGTWVKTISMWKRHT